MLGRLVPSKRPYEVVGARTGLIDSSGRARLAPATRTRFGEFGTGAGGAGGAVSA